MIKAHKIRLNPTPEQANYFARAAGTARFVWNWALAEWNRQYEAGEKPTALKLKKQFNEIRREQFPWTWEGVSNSDIILTSARGKLPRWGPQSNVAEVVTLF
jgi:putative transposase